MANKDCTYPEYLKMDEGGEPCECSCEQMRICHERSGGKHPLPTQEQIRKEQEAKGE